MVVDQNLPVAGLFPDPRGVPNRLKYWNGNEWEEQYQIVDSVKPLVSSSIQQNQTSVINDTDKNLRLVAFILQS